MMTRLNTHCVLLVAVLFSLPVFAQDARVTDRISLPVDGSTVDLTGMLGDDGTIVLQGTLSSRYDGAEIDAFARRAESARFEADGPFVILPPSAQILEEDVLAHRYVVKFAAGERPTIAFAIARLASRQLQTRSQAARELSGRIEVQVHGPATVALVAPVAAAIVPPAPTPDATGWLWGLLGFAPVAGWFAWRRRRERWRLWMQRATRAATSVDKEARRLGPAYDDVVSASQKLVERAQGIHTHAREIVSAQKRIEGTSGEVDQRRERLQAQLKLLETNMEAVVGRLEGVAAELATQVAGRANVSDLEATVRAVGSELEIALAADREVF